MNKVLVLGCDSRIALSVIRSLGRGKLQVHVAWNQPDPVTAQSRYLSRTHFLPPYSATDSAWCGALVDLMKREKFDLVIPCTDQETTACQRHGQELSEYGRVYLLNPEAYDVLYDKFKTHELARKVGVRIPRQVLIKEGDPAADSDPPFALPVVLKPRQSSHLENSGPFQKVRKTYSRAEYRRLLPAMLEGGPVGVQENFIGVGVGVELLMENGRPLLAFQHQRVHEPLQGGPSSYRKSVPVSHDLLAASVKIFEKVRYTGVAMAEFKVNPCRPTDWVFLEVNARFWGSLPLAIAAGADFPLALYQFLVQGRRSFPQSYRKGIHSRNWEMDRAWWWENLHADHSDPTLATQAMDQVAIDALVHFLTGRERADTLTLDDPAPGLAELGGMVRGLGRRLAKWFGFSRNKTPQTVLSPAHRSRGKTLEVVS